MDKFYTNLVPTRRIETQEKSVSASANTLPSVTIITPTLNAAPHLETALRSLQGQNFPRLQHVIADGGSTDATAEIAARYPASEFFVVAGNPHVAVNAALARATGEIVGFLCADDVLEPGALAVIADFFQRHPEAEAVRGLCYLRDRTKGEDAEMEFLHLHGDQLWLQLLYGTPATTSWFFRRAFIEAAGGFNDAYRYSADRLFLLRALAVLGDNVPLLDVPVYTYYAHAQSMTLSKNVANRISFLNEHLNWSKDLLASCPDAKLRELLANWRVFEAYQLMRLALRGGKLMQALHAGFIIMQHPWRLWAATRTRAAFLAAAQAHVG